MRQPKGEKGNPTNPTGGPTTKPAAFTDGSLAVACYMGKVDGKGKKQEK